MNWICSLISWLPGIVILGGVLCLAIRHSKKMQKKYMEMYEKNLSHVEGIYEKNFSNQKEMIGLLKEIRDLLRK